LEPAGPDEGATGADGVVAGATGWATVIIRPSLSTQNLANVFLIEAI
jgi:hypothetical protein